MQARSSFVNGDRPRASLLRLLAPAVEAAILNCLREVRGGDRAVAGEVGDGACDTQDARVGAGGETQALARRLEELPSARVDGAEAAHLAAGDARVETDPLAEARAL